MVRITLPVRYSAMSWQERRHVRNTYVTLQQGDCWYCDTDLEIDPSHLYQNTPVDWSLFPDNFQRYPVHLQHNHDTDMTEGAVHAMCNAVMWQYEGR